MRAYGLAILVTIACALPLAACGSVGDTPGGVTASASGAAAGMTATTTQPAPKATKQPKRSTPKPTPRPKTTKAAVSKPATRMVFVDVGQGDAAIINSGSWTGLIDGGPSGAEGAIENALRAGGGSGKVYITDTGECYHRGDCRYLSHSKIPDLAEGRQSTGLQTVQRLRPADVTAPR
jgi:hypothetical protein